MVQPMSSLVCPQTSGMLITGYLTLKQRYIDDPEEPASFSDANCPDVLLLLSKDFLEAHAALHQYAEVNRPPAPMISALEHVDWDWSLHSAMFDDNDHLAENFPIETRETLSDAEYYSTLEALFPTFTGEITSGGLALDASHTCCTSTIQTELHSPQNAQEILTTPDINEVHQLQGSLGEACSPQTATTSDTCVTTSGDSRVPQASSRTRRSQKNMGPFQLRRSPRLSARATAEQGGHKGAFGQFGAPSSEQTTRPARKGSKPLPSGTQWKEYVYELAWEGTMFAKLERQLLVSKAQAYKIKSAPESLTAAWPRLLKVGNIIPQVSLDRSFAGQAHDLIFEVKGDDNIHNLLQRNELCIRYSLPAQSLIITPSEHNHLTGKVYAGEGPSYIAGT